MSDFEIGEIVTYRGKEYEVVGLSTMVWEDDGEPEWKITHEIQEVAIADIREGVTWQKPAWLPVREIKSTKPVYTAPFLDGIDESLDKLTIRKQL
jgi:hypothetical protein